MKPKSTASAKYTCLISITLALLGIQGCHWDDSMYQQYVKDDTVTSCEYDLLSLNDGRYIKKLDEDKWVCGDYNHVVLAENQTSSEVCVNKTPTSADKCCTEDDIRLAAKTMKDKLCPKSAHNCVPRVLKNGQLSDQKDMCSEYKDSSINCKKNRVNLASDPNNCGACGNICPGGDNAICSEGTCGTKTCEADSCPIGEGKTVCVNLSTDNKYCGSCENVCTTKQRCDRTQDPENPKCIENDCKDTCKKDDILSQIDESIKDQIPEMFEEIKSTMIDDNTICIDPSNSQICGITSCEDFVKHINMKKLGCTGGMECINNGKAPECSCPDGTFLIHEKCLSPSHNNACGAHQKGDNDEGTVCNEETGFCGITTDGQYACHLCKSGFVRCGEKCIDPDTTDEFCNANANCKVYQDCTLKKQICVKGVCECPDGQAACGLNNECVPLDDPDVLSNHCGATSKGLCSEEDGESKDYAGEKCQRGQCIYDSETKTGRCGCRSGEIECDGDCVDTSRPGNIGHIRHCGMTSCTEGNKGTDCTYIMCNEDNPNCVACEEGTCACDKGSDTLVNDYPLSDGTKVSKCVNIDTDNYYCGSEHKNCAENNQWCYDGECINRDCKDGEIACNGTCYNMKDMHIKSCTECDEIVDGVSYCSDGELLVNGCQSRPDNGNENHCGHCNNKCENGKICINNSCQCEKSLTRCEYNIDGEDQEFCLNLQELHLADCEKCASGWEDSDHQFWNGCNINLLTDVDNCGSVGHRCHDANNHFSGNVSCQNGICVPDRCESRYDNCDKTNEDCEADLASVTTCGDCNTECQNGSTCQNSTCCHLDNLKVDAEIDKCCNPSSQIYKLWYKKRYQCATERPTWYQAI